NLQPRIRSLAVADEVTKKDLQAVQKDYNKQFADVKKQIETLDKKVDDNRREFLSDSEEANKISVNIRSDLGKRCDELQDGVNALAKAISELAGRVQKLEKGR